MASSSSARSSQCPRWKYNVFLSFRGEDTRKTFTSHLYRGLETSGIFTFQDDKRLEHGDSISEELLRAIEESQVAIIIFSKNYAASSWCLDELVKIMKCKDEYGQMVIPVFYDIDPATVRYQKDNFADAFDKHESRYKVDDVEGMQKVNRWRTALTTAANLNGCVISDGIESEHIEQIVDQVSFILRTSTSLSYLGDVVGVKTHLERAKSLLDLEINDVRIVGIWGMGGVGKTTIASAIFDTLSYQFEGACFLADIKENAKRYQLHSLQNTLLSNLLRRKDDYVNDKHAGKNMIRHRLCSKKVLIVLDDIDHRDHLDYLAGGLDWFGNGSRVIATTRDKHLIGKKDVVYEVTTLGDSEAIQLFNRYAFKEEVPDKCFEALTLKVVSYSSGLPLALKVWGSFLYKKDVTEWRSALKLMKNNSNSEIVEKLKISYDGLEPMQKEIFLDIACFLRGEKKDQIVQILESCEFRADIGLRVLIDKSLVFISQNDTIQMHDLIQDMGRYIVNLQKNPGERSRLWFSEDFKEVMINNMGTKTVEAIWVQLFENPNFSMEAMKCMKRLRILCIRALITHEGSDSHERFIEYLSNNLRWFIWDRYPWESLPANFEPIRLVHLKLINSSLRLFQTGAKHFPSLRALDLSCSKSLTQTPNFTGMPNLEYLYLGYCDSLEEVHDSLGNCNKLIRLDLQRCYHLKRFSRVNMESLEYLNVEYCSRLEKFPEILGKAKLELEIDMTCSLLRKLNLSRLYHLVGLPSIIWMLVGLVELDVSSCKQLESLPEEIGDLENLEKLDASNTLISRPPSSIVRLNKLKFLSFAKGELDGVKHREFFVFPSVAEGLRSLEKLNLSYCNLIDRGLPEDIGCLSSLKDLDLSGNNFEHLPPSIGKLGALQSLKLSYCRMLKEFPDFLGMQNSETLGLYHCNLRDVELLEDIGCLSSLENLDLTGNNFEHLPQSISQLGALQSLNLSHCERLTQLPELPPELYQLRLDCDMALKSIPYLATKKNLREIICIRLHGEDEPELNLLAHTLFQNISSLQHDISASVVLSQRVVTILKFVDRIPSWFHHQGRGNTISVDLPENWYECDNFFGVAVCYSGELTKTTAQLIPLCNDGMTQELALCNYSGFSENDIHFFFVPLAGLWDTSQTNGRTPNDYVLLMLSFSEYWPKFGYRLLYKNELELESLLQMWENKEHHDSGTNEANCSSSKEQSSHSNIRGRVTRLFRNLAALSCKPKTLS